MMRRLGPALALALALSLSLALLGPAPAMATQDAWPALHDVTGVADDDVLNIRAAPSATAPIIGSFAPDARDIEVIAPDDRHGWGLVNLGEGTGWASLRFLQRQPGQWLGSFPPLSRCLGTEPFWSLHFTPEDGMRHATPDGGEIYGSVHQRLVAANRRDRFAVTFLLADGREGSVTLSAARCGDGMSSRAYGLTGDVLIDGPQGRALLSGCCTLAP